MTVDTNPISIPVPPLRRNTPVRHRRSVTGWQLERTARYTRAWLAQPIRATRAQHAKLAGVYGSIAVVAGLLAAVFAR